MAKKKMPMKVVTKGAKKFGQKWKKDVLVAHNRLRARHGCLALKWSNKVYSEAKLHANRCQAKGKMFHGFSPGVNHGQNIYWSIPPCKKAVDAVFSWYNEIKKPGYNFKKPGFSTGTGHFTQVVWKATTHVGMAKSKDGRFIVANYSPPGNMMGAFPANVKPPKKKH